ncbi:MAG: hypothetical protein WBA23_06920 [Tunicatimonas sp.]|uniref:hypothetical protein n=1 Tax=Tunicatimonas sp. TaxID=1940096 RepID=UPI003C7198B3
MHYFSSLLFILGFSTSLFAQNNPSPTSLNQDSLRAEIMQLRTELEETQTNLRISHNRFRTGILTSAIGYSIVILGGVLGGSEDYAEWGQPLIFAGGVVGVAGAIFIFNSNTYIGRAGGIPSRRERKEDER